jgi:hypothetical protein
MNSECYYSDCPNHSQFAKHHDDIVDEPICTLDHCIASEEELLAYQQTRCLTRAKRCGTMQAQCTGEIKMKVWVVVEEDRGCGVFVEGVYLSEDDANKARGSRQYVFESQIHAACISTATIVAENAEKILAERA